MIGSYKEQYRRASEQLDICRASYAVNGHAGIPFDANEPTVFRIHTEFIHLFQDLYHLKDWIINDTTVPSSIQNQVEAFINGSQQLTLLRDVANASKHLVLNQPHVDPHVSTNVQPILSAPIGSFPMGGFYGYSIVIETGAAGQDIEALNFAELCLNEWDQFFITYSL